MATWEHFTALGVPILFTDDTRAAIEFAAAIGFSCDAMRGTICIGMGGATLNALAPSRDRQYPRGPQHWLSELSNQLLGRWKRKLLRYDVNVSIALPRVVEGARLSALVERSHPARMFRFQTERGSGLVWSNVRVKANLRLVEVADEPEAPSEGSLVLF